MTYSTTAPTFATSEVVTAAKMNALADGIQAAGTTYGSGSSWTASSVNPALGNGTWNGRYQQIGKWIYLETVITMGSTTTYGTGQWRIALPVTARASFRWRFTVECVDTSAGGAYTNSAVCDASASFTSLVVAAGGTTLDSAIGSAAPFTWATTDVLTIQGWYEAA